MTKERPRPEREEQDAGWTMRRAQVEEVEKYPKRLTIRLPKDLHEDLRWLSFEPREPLQTMALRLFRAELERRVPTLPRRYSHRYRTVAGEAKRQG